MGKRSERLLALMQALRRRRRPVTGQVLAEETGVSLRTLYRDIESLKGMGAAIDGEAGVGFQLRADYWLPPLMFTSEEIEALVLGLRTLIHGPDAELGQVARDASAKIAAVLPDERREEYELVGLFAVPPWEGVRRDERLAMVRKALREETEMPLDYRDLEGRETSRVIWPVALGYYQNRQMLVAWCTLRQDFRRFWIDSMLSLKASEKRYPRPRRTLMHEWRRRENLHDFT